MLRPHHSQVKHLAPGTGAQPYDPGVDASTAAQRLRLALDMYEVGERMQRQRLRRQRPAATEEEIEAEVRAWRQHRPAAPTGDHPGPPSRRFA